MRFGLVPMASRYCARDSVSPVSAGSGIGSVPVIKIISHIHTLTNEGEGNILKQENITWKMKGEMVLVPKPVGYNCDTHLGRGL